MSDLFKVDFIRPALAIAFSVLVAQGVSAEQAALEEILVTADFRQSPEKQYATSLSIVGSEQIKSRAAQHLEEILNIAPNVNFAAGASRGRFFQVRGIGERSQYKEPLDSSVGLIVDGIDFTNLGLAGVLADVQQVEVLRGPQGTRFGSNAMAGAINIVTKSPTEKVEGSVGGSVGNYGAWSTNAVLSGPLADNLLGRIAVQKNASDGYIENDFLQRNDTNNIDEETVQAKLRWLASEELTVDMAVIYLNIDNGYDAFSLSHDRHTRSDEPGRDQQESTALSLKANWDGFEASTLEVLLTREMTDLEYAFDWDWSDWDTVGVRGKENNTREREADSVDLRFISKPGYEILGGASWVGGLYAYQRDVELDYVEDADYWGAWTGYFNNDFQSNRYAAYGQLDWSLNDRMNLSVGGRIERFDNRYHDSFGVKGDNADNLWAGRVSLEYFVTDDTMVYGTVSRGYKTGGLNTDALGKALVSGDDNTIAQVSDNFIYDAETLTNYEVGVKGIYLDGSLTLAMSGFYMDREDMQSKVSWLISAPSNWSEYRENIDGSKNYGAELEFGWQVTDTLELFGSLGLLETELGDLVVVDPDDDTKTLDQSGRDQAHAPNYQYNIGVNYDLSQSWRFTVAVDGKDAFYFSDSHNQKSDRYELMHASLSWTQDNLIFSVWGRNLLDKDYELRGFYWGNNPDNGWINESYTQLGEPRVIGMAASYNF